MCQIQNKQKKNELVKIKDAHFFVRDNNVESCKELKAGTLDSGSRVKRGYPYILRNEMEVASLFNTRLVSGCEKKVLRPYQVAQSKAVRDAKRAVTTILSKTYQKWKTYAKAKSKEICKEIYFSSFFRKMLMSTVLSRQIKANYLEKMRGYPYLT